MMFSRQSVMESDVNNAGSSLASRYRDSLVLAGMGCQNHVTC